MTTPDELPNEEKDDLPLPYQAEDLTQKPNLRFPNGEVSNFGNYFLRSSGKQYSYFGRYPLTFKFSTIFENISRFIETTIGGGSSGISSQGITAGVTIAANSSESIELSVTGGATTLEAFDDSSFSCIFFINDIGVGGAGDNGTFYIGVDDGAGTFNGTTLNLSGVDQYGFKAIKTDGVVSLYATSSNDTGTETTTLIGTISELEVVFLTAICEVPEKITFQVFSSSLNMTVVHTTNIPRVAGMTSNAGRIFINNSNTAKAFQIIAGSYTFEKRAGGLY